MRLPFLSVHYKRASPYILCTLGVCHTYQLYMKYNSSLVIKLSGFVEMLRSQTRCWGISFDEASIYGPQEQSLIVDWRRNVETAMMTQSYSDYQ